MFSIRTNTLRIPPEELKAMLEKKFSVETVPWYNSAFIVEGDRITATIEYMQGFFYVQSLSSMLPVLTLDPKPGETILDMAAAPGSKTTQIAMHMLNKGALIANDESFLRLKPLGGHLDRLGILNCAITNYDGSIFPKSHLFDRVLLDAPCSGLGSRHEHMKFSPNRLRQLEKLQKDMLVRAFDLVRQGGRVVYSTCTTRTEENENVVRRLLEKRENVKLIKPNLPVDFDYDIGARVTLDESFFIACMEKI